MNERTNKQNEQRSPAISNGLLYACRSAEAWERLDGCPEKAMPIDAQEFGSLIQLPCNTTEGLVSVCLSFHLLVCLK